MIKWISSLFTDDKCGSEIVGRKTLIELDAQQRVSEYLKLEASKVEANKACEDLFQAEKQHDEHIKDLLIKYLTVYQEEFKQQGISVCYTEILTKLDLHYLKILKQRYPTSCEVDCFIMGVCEGRLDSHILTEITLKFEGFLFKIVGNEIVYQMKDS